MVQLSGKYAFVIPDSPKMNVDIFIPLNMINNAQHGQKVIAEIVDWPKGTKIQSENYDLIRMARRERCGNEFHSAEYGFLSNFQNA
ncbi:MAG: hypothetical protein IPI10_14460 [Bacteroidetes bacterium]|nr:hypothetical protein [Bacteroidota bacterium]